MGFRIISSWTRKVLNRTVLSACSRPVFLVRQTVIDDAKPSPGQAALVPVQLSATSHEPPDDRQIVEADLKASTGQLALVPVHASPTSHAPAAPRHVVPEGW